MRSVDADSMGKAYGGIPSERQYPDVVESRCNRIGEGIKEQSDVGRNGNIGRLELGITLCTML